MSREFALLVSPQELLETSLAQLRTLTAFLHDHLYTGHQKSASAGPETRACEEIMRSLDEIIATARDLRS